MQKYYQNEPRFKGFYSTDNLPKEMDEAYGINFDGYTEVGTHWIAFYVKNIGIIHFDSFGVENVPKKHKNKHI